MTTTYSKMGAKWRYKAMTGISRDMQSVRSQKIGGADRASEWLCLDDERDTTERELFKKVKVDEYEESPEGRGQWGGDETCGEAAAQTRHAANSAR